MGAGVGVAHGVLSGRTRRAVATRVSTGHVVMVLAGALGVLLTLTVLRSADTTRPVLVAARDLAPGIVIGDDALRVARVHADASVLATLYSGNDVTRLRGAVITTSVGSGELLTRRIVRDVDAHASTRVMSFSIARARAVAGKLTAGDHVDVLAVDHNAARAGYVLVDAEVVTVDSRGGGALSGASDDVIVTLTVDGRRAPGLASAIDAGTVMLVRSTGAAPLRDAPMYTPRSSP